MEKPMRIAFDSYVFAVQQYGGISRYVCSLASSLSHSTGIDVRIFAPLHVSNYLEKLPVGVVSGRKIPKIPKTGLLIRNFNRAVEQVQIGKFKPDVVHHTYYSSNVNASLSAPRIVTVYDMIHERFPSQFPVSDAIFKLKKTAIRRADHVICISENTRSDLLASINLPADKVSVVHLGYDVFTAPATEREEHTKPFLLYVGGRDGYKNFERFVRAYASSAWLTNNFRVVCFGGGEFTRLELELLKALGISTEHVTQLGGDDSRLATLYRDAAIFVYPSTYEGFGIPPLEAMSMDCPIACSNVSSIPEVTGDAAEYFDPYSIESIRFSVENILTSKLRRSELIHLGRLRRMKFSWRRCADETLSVYKGLM